MGGQQSFRSTIYGSYGDTHHVYGDAAVAASRGRRTQIETALLRWLPADRGARVLDFGCGDGTLLSIAEHLGYRRLFGVDVSPGLVTIAGKNTKAQLTTGDGLAYLAAATSETFDAIIAFDVLEHLTRDELISWVTQASRLLAPGGTVIIHVPNGCSPFVGRVLWGDLTHEQAFTPLSLGQLFRSGGFSGGAAFEDPPLAHGLKSKVRALLWKLVRMVAIGWLAVEIGVTGDYVLTINLFYVVRK
jgi:SAM-dependent methyltransferase